jgi:hypothetical protein
MSFPFFENGVQKYAFNPNFETFYHLISGFSKIRNGSGSQVLGSGGLVLFRVPQTAHCLLVCFFYQILAMYYDYLYIYRVNKPIILMLLHFLKRFVLISCISLFSLNISAQDFWEALNTPTGIAIRSVAINDLGHIFLGVGNNSTQGGVYRSDNEGETWDLVFDSGDFSVNPVEINEAGDIYIGRAGYDRMMVSNDNGETWGVLYPPGDGNVTAIETVDTNVLFVGTGLGGNVLLTRSINSGISWDTIFTNTNSTEYITDILQTQSGNMYLSLTGYFADMGGVYKSTDGGDSWSYSGLFNLMVSSLAENSEGDVFASVRGFLQSGLSPGLYVLRNGEDEWEALLAGPFVEDVVVNSADHLYLTSGGVLRSLNDGQTFEIINEGLPPGPRGEITINDLDYIYVIAKSASHSLHRTINSTVSIAEEYYMPSKNSLILYPNPVDEQLFVGNLFDGPEYQYEVYIYNAQGKVIKQEEVFSSGSQLMIDVSVLPSGFYVISVITDCKRINDRFIKK